MTRQEEIGNELAELYRDMNREGTWCVVKRCGQYVDECGVCFADKVLQYLDEKGVVIKGALLTFEGKPVGFEVEPLVER